MRLLLLLLRAFFSSSSSSIDTQVQWNNSHRHLIRMTNSSECAKLRIHCIRVVILCHIIVLIRTVHVHHSIVNNVKEMNALKWNLHAAEESLPPTKDMYGYGYVWRKQQSSVRMCEIVFDDISIRFLPHHGAIMCTPCPCVWVSFVLASGV